MSSSTLLGDRRWASSRKGMTVLGKVPKPINLPSQRLENHGLDPNVEIVPKGTVTWGCRPSAPTNAWGSLSHSPSSGDGSIGSPSRHNGRPSSGGTGTRPSTAGSDRCSEPAANSWASSSRPSSASGILASNQAPLAATRPRSAETRPGSSQLSRFAESIPGNSVPWGAGSAGRLGSTSKTSDFMLSSGDFPTLGSAKNSEVVHGQQAGTDSSHGHPPTSGLSSREQEGFNSSRETGAQLEKDNSNAWKVDMHPYNTTRPLSNSNSWHVDLPSNKLPPSTSMQPHHYSWHGPPQSPPDGIWYRGVPPGPYGPGVGPAGSYLSDPFAYYSSQHTPRPSNNLNSSPQSGAVLGGYPHKKEESFRPSVTSDSYMIPSIPVIPVRPGIYASPMAYDGYYGPPRAGFSGSSERERPIMGMAAGPGIYNQFSNQNLVRDSGKSGNCTDASIPMGDEQVEGSHSHDSHGEQYRVLLKHHEEFDDNETGNTKGHFNAMPLKIASKKDSNVLEEELKTDGKGVELTKTTQGGICLGAPGNSSIGQTQVPHSKDIPGPGKVQTSGDCHVKKVEPMTPQSNVQHILKKPSLIEKIEGLNNKVRVTEGRSEAIVSYKEERSKRIKSENVRVENSTKAMQSPFSSISKGPSENVHIGSKSMLHDDQENALKKKSSGYAGNVKVVSQESAMTADNVPENSEIHPNVQAEHIRGDASHGRSDHHSKSRINDSEVWRLQIPGRESSSINATRKKVDKASEVDPQGGLADPGKQPYVNKVREEALPVDSADFNAQRAKMKEMAAQRAKQLQKEEEERIREQKAKALAKLEELDRRTMADASAQNIDCASAQSSALSHKQDQVVVNVQKFDANVPSSTETDASGPIPKVNDGILCSVGGTSMQKNKKLAGSVAHPRVSGKRPEDAVLKQKVDFSSNSQISFGTVRTCDSSMNDVAGFPEVQKCVSGFDQPREGTDAAGSGSQTSQSVAGNTQESPFSSKVGNGTSQKSNDCPPDNSAKHSHAGQRRRNTVLQEKNPVDTFAPSDAAGPQFPSILAAGSVSLGDSLVQNSVEASGPSVQLKKKGSRSIRPRSRPEQCASSSMQVSQVRTEGILEKPPESCKIETALPIEPTVPAQSQTIEYNIGGQDSREDIALANSGWSQSAEEVQAKTTGQWKTHPPRRSTKNGQSRPSDKSRGSEAVVWAPVRLPSKGEPAEEEQTAEDQDPFFKSGTDSQNLKYKRADIERYVPKFVAKDMSQQRNTQKALPPINTKSENARNEVDSSKSNSNDDARLPKCEVPVDIRSVEINRPSKHGKGHASWRQRSSLEGFSDATKPISKFPDQNLPSKTGSSLDRGSSHITDGNDSSNTISVPPSEPVVTVVKDQGMVSRGKRHAHKMHKSMAANSTVMDAKVSLNGASDKPNMHAVSVGLDALNGKNLPRAENVSQVERTRSHWKPKSNQPSVTKHQENSNSEASQHADLIKESEGNHTMQQATDSVETGNFQQYLGRKDKNLTVASSEDQIESSSKDLSNLVEQNPGKSDPRSGLHRQGRHDGQLRKGQDGSYGGRFNRGQEAHYGGRSTGQDIGYWSGDRRRQNYHYEYQRVESHYKSNDQQGNAPTEDNAQYGNSRAAGPRYRERGHPRRGGQFYARSGAPVQGGETQ